MAKSVLITGGSRGIGYETALLFAQKGYDVGFTYLKSDDGANKLKNKIENMGQQCFPYKSDVSDFNKMQEVFEDFMRCNKHIDALICNAAVSPYGTITDMSFDEIKTAFDINVLGVINTCKLAAPYMVSQKYGSIVTLSSIWGITGSSCETIYSATKGAIISFSKALAKELGPSNIRVNVVAPGVVMTDMMSDFSDDDISALKEMSALNKVSYPQEIAKTILFLCSEDTSSYTGQVLSPNCGILI